MFTEEDTPKTGEEAPAPASEETPSETPVEETPAKETPSEETPAEETPAGTPNQEEENKRLQDENATLNALTETQEKQLNQAGFNIEKYKRLLKENNIEPDEADSLSEEKILELVAAGNKPLVEMMQKFTKTISEINRANVTKKSVPGAPGQTPPSQTKEPVLTGLVKDVIQRRGLKWTGKGLIYKSPKTNREYDLEDESNID